MENEETEMIECTFKCIKGFGSEATKRVLSEMNPDEIDVCDDCFDILKSMGKVEVIEEYE